MVCLLLYIDDAKIYYSVMSIVWAYPISENLTVVNEWTLLYMGLNTEKSTGLEFHQIALVLPYKTKRYLL